MTPEDQRIAIAETCGWKDIVPCTCGIEPTGLSPFTNTRGNHLPDYLFDLNACHEMEKVLFGKNLWPTYEDKLMEVLLRDGKTDRLSQIYSIHATATQRSEAFLRTLNLWVEDSRAPSVQTRIDNA